MMPVREALRIEKGLISLIGEKKKLRFDQVDVSLTDGKTMAWRNYFASGITQTVSELWIVRGDRPVLWALPYRMEPCGQGVRIWPAVPLREKEKSAATALLRPLGEPEGDDWLLTHFRLRKVAEKVPDKEPEQYAIWHRPHMRQVKHWARSPGQAGIEDFTDALFMAGVGETREEVATWWYHFRNHMLDWLINKEREVDLGFVKLHQSARRLNWLIQTHFCGRRQTVPLTNQPKVLKNNQKFMDRVSGRSVVEVRTNGTVRRFIDVEHGKEWEALTKRVETTRLKLLKPRPYAKHTLAGLARGADVAAKLFAVFSARSVAPSAVFLPSFTKGGFLFMPPGPNGRMSKTKRRAIEAARDEYLHQMHPSRFRKKCKVAALPELRAVQSSGPDVRNGGGVPAGRDDARVLVRDERKIILGAGQLLEVGGRGE